MEQRSDEWFKAREGMLTASRFGDVMARKGTKRSELYIRETVLALEGTPKFEDNAKWFEHGIEFEAEGLGAYAFHKGVVVKEVGFIVHPDIPYIGCSPDGIVADGGVELKCRSSLSAHHKSVKAGIDSCYKHQVQGCMWVMGTEWHDFVSYYVPLDRFNGATTDLHIHRVYRDESFINKLQARCEEFWAEVQQQLEDRKNGESKI